MSVKFEGSCQSLCEAEDNIHSWLEATATTLLLFALCNLTSGIPKIPPLRPRAHKEAHLSTLKPIQTVVEVTDARCCNCPLNVPAFCVYFSPFKTRILPSFDASKVVVSGDGVRPRGVLASMPTSFVIDTREAGLADLDVVIQVGNC